MKARKDRWSNERKMAASSLPFYESILDRFPNSIAAAKKVEETRRKAKGE